MPIPRASFSTRYANGAVLLTDLDGSMSITNDAEAVVEHVLSQGSPDVRIFYKDTDGQWDELVHDGKAFTAFFHISDADRAAFNLN